MLYHSFVVSEQYYQANWRQNGILLGILDGFETSKIAAGCWKDAKGWC